MLYDTAKKQFHTLGTDDFSKWFDKRFNADSTMHFDIAINNSQAFFCFEIPLFNKLITIQQKNSELNNLFNALPPIAARQYIRNSLVIDVKKTNEIEGVFSSRKEIFELTEDLKKRESNKIGSIVNKYLLLLKGDSEKNVRTCQNIRKIYDDLFLSNAQSLIDPDKLPDGDLFRKGDVGVYDLGSDKPIHKGVYPEEKIKSYLNEGLKILNDKGINVFVRIALFHYIFEYTHPFYDGNGRIGRYLISLFFKNEISNIFAFRVSAGINNFKKQYYKAFKETEDVLNKGDLTLFVYEFLDILDKTYDDCIDYAKNKKQLLKDRFESLKKKFNDLSKNEENVLYVLTQASIFSDFGITIKEIIDSLKISLRTVRRCLEILKSKKILKEERHSRYIFYNLAN